jgi:hypothetical protein
VKLNEIKDLPTRAEKKSLRDWRSSVPRAVITVPVFAVDRTTPQGFTLYIERLRHHRTMLDDLNEAESSVDRCTGVDIPPAAASKENRCKGVNIVPGAPTDQSAYRSEVTGLFLIATRPLFGEFARFMTSPPGPSTLGATVSPLCLIIPTSIT